MAVYNVQSHARKRICYMHDNDFLTYHYGPAHPMKPWRISVTHDLVMSYGLDSYMDVYRPRPASMQELMLFHTRDFVEMLREPRAKYSSESGEIIGPSNFNLLTDCPAELFPNLWTFCQLYAGGSLMAAEALIKGEYDIAINWSGGLHHAQKQRAFGFCYVNDINLAIVKLLEHFKRVLYIDIDIHHGDGVQKAFYDTSQVLTVSLHRYGDDFFPGTGHIEENGVSNGHFYCYNLPLREGITDDLYYTMLYEPILTKLKQVFQPDVVVLQCGADSLAGDKLGSFSLSIDGHANCVRLVKSWNLPLLVLGGGGYSPRNVARCWAYETAVLCGQDSAVPRRIPESSMFRSYFAQDDFATRPNLLGCDNCNSTNYIEFLRLTTLKKIKKYVRGGMHDVEKTHKIVRDLVMANIAKQDQQQQQDQNSSSSQRLHSHEKSNVDSNKSVQQPPLLSASSRISAASSSGNSTTALNSNQPQNLNNFYTKEEEEADDKRIRQIERQAQKQSSSDPSGLVIWNHRQNMPPKLDASTIWRGQQPAV